MIMPTYTNEILGKDRSFWTIKAIKSQGEHIICDLSHFLGIPHQTPIFPYC